MDRPPLPPPLTPAAERERARFTAAYERNLERLKDIALSILVWGPAPETDTPVARKRREIRDRLIGEGHYATFSEDVPGAVAGASWKTRELAQARAAHLVVILYGDSPGAIAETHDFCAHPDVSSKVLVIIPRKFRTGYAGRGAIRDLDDAHRAVFWYTDDDLSACRVCGCALRRAQGLRSLRFHGGAA
ncbi:MAG TPA: hypothetical protein VHG93_04105 [Longimicrobium sp.]|nr:hypothetical protein [Longimicrobium sp.]